MKTQRLNKIVSTLALVILMSFSANTWAGKIGISDATSKVGFGDGVARAVSNLPSRIESAPTGLARVLKGGGDIDAQTRSIAAVAASLSRHYSGLSRVTQSGRVSMDAKIEEDIRSVEAELNALKTLPKAEVSEDAVAKLDGLLQVLKQFRAESSELVHVRAEFSTGDSPERARLQSQKMVDITASGRPDALQSSFKGLVSLDGKASTDAVFVAVTRTGARDDMTRALPASAEGARLLTSVFSGLDGSRDLSFADVKVFHATVIAKIEAASATPEVKASLKLVARNLDPNGVFFLARSMGLSTADIVALSQRGIPLVTRQGGTPDLSGVFGKNVLEKWSAFHANLHQLVGALNTSDSAFRTEADVRRFLVRDFTRVLAASQDFGSSQLSLAQKIAGALSKNKGSKVDVNSPEVRKVLADVAESLYIMRKNDPRTADLLASAVKNRDVEEIARLLKDESGKDVLSDFRKRSKACAT